MIRIKKDKGNASAERNTGQREKNITTYERDGARVQTSSLALLVIDIVEIQVL